MLNNHTLSTVITPHAHVPSVNILHVLGHIVYTACDSIQSCIIILGLIINMYMPFSYLDKNVSECELNQFRDWLIKIIQY